jgi:hypothetical protein
MQEKEYLTASEVLKMLERPVVIAYGRETFNRLLKTQRHTLICTRYPQDFDVVKWCADFLFRQKGISTYFDYDKTKYGQTICCLVAGEVGWWFGQVEYYLRILKEDHDFLVTHKHDFPPETLRSVNVITFWLEYFITRLEDDLVYYFEDAYNTHLWKPSVGVDYVCKKTQATIDEIDKYINSDKVSDLIYELRQYIQAKGGDH